MLNIKTLKRTTGDGDYSQKKYELLKKEEVSELGFSIALLIVQLHKYSSYLYDKICLRITFFRSDSPAEVIDLTYSLSDDQTFASLCRQVEQEIGSFPQEKSNGERKKIDIHWITDAETEQNGSHQHNGEHQYPVHLVINTDFCKARFSCAPLSYLQPVLEKAERHFKTLAHNALFSSRIQIKDLGCLSNEEFEEITSLAYGPVEKEIARPELLHTLFDQTAEQYPAKDAVVYGQQTLTYQELNQKANRLAHFLIRQGVKPGDFIGLLLERTPEMYVAMLGILKAGAAYVPLDAEYPEERVRYILEDSSAKCLISSTSFKDSYSHFTGTILNIDQELIPALSDDSFDDRPQVSTDPHSPAYVIYTSGTTGRPKGVVIPHASASNLVKAEKNIFELSPIDSVLQGFSVAFDASIEEIWLAFLSGATLFPADREVMCSAHDLSEFIHNNKITVFSTVPTLLSMMEPPLSSLELLILGGEECPHELLERWNRKGLRIVNTYGPTEGTVIATCDDFTSGEEITIGKPIPNYAVFITDADRNPVPAGVPGELCIAAANGVASGYLNREELTAKKFIEAPFPVDAGFSKRIYRTGDLARINEKGQVEFLGRIDSQVKLRGYRIELSEIESQLMQFENVKNAVVAVKEDQHQVKRLVAYLLMKDASLGFDKASCKNFLKSTLASYMIPSVFMVMEDFPTLPSGKVDRKNLPEPEENIATESRTITKPRDDTEQKIYDVLEKYFSPQQVSITDDFFLDLGGHSLLAAKVVSRLRHQTDFEDLSVLDIYQNSTVEELAAELKSRRKSTKDREEQSKEKPKEKTNTADARPIPSKIRHFCCGVLQSLGLYFVFGINMILSVTGFLAYFFFHQNGYAWPEASGLALVSAIVAYPAVILFVVAAKWLLLGRIKPGRYKLWGWFYVRWWLVQNLVGALHLDYLAGTPLLPFFLRLLGMQVGRDVQLETGTFAAFDVISIGDGTSVDEDASIPGFKVEDGYLTIKSVTIGSHCFVGTRSVVGEGAVMENGARLGDLSLLPSGEQIPEGETWEGSPAQKTEGGPVVDLPPRPEYGPWRRAVTAALYAALVFIIPIVSFIAFVPGIVLLFQFDPIAQPLLYLGLLPPVGASFILLLTTEVVIVKRLLVGCVRPGTYPVHGGFYIRNWIVNQLLRMCLNHMGQLHATLHVAPWYRALGAKIGRFVELSTASSATPDLIELDDGSTIADEATLGSPHIEGGWMTIQPVHMGQRAFAGNSAVIPTGSEVGDGSLVGVLSITPEPEKARQENSTWFGSPAVLFPKREPSDGFSEERTYRPPRKLRLARGTFELLRITMPTVGSLFVIISVIIAALELWPLIGLGATLLALPAVSAVSSIAVILAVALTKWIVVGRYKPFNRPLWSNFVWRLEFVNALYEFLSAPLILNALQGTPFLPWYLRLLGAKIGRRCYINTTGFLEWDLVDIGDRVELCSGCVMQTHLFEDRILKASGLHIGDDCKVGVASVVLYDTEMKDGSSIDDLSLLMKGESISAGTSWIGCPAKFTKS